MLKYFTVALCYFTCLTSFSQSPTITQQRCLGGSLWENLGSVGSQVTRDSGYIMVATTNSNDGDVSGLHNSGTTEPLSDIWLVKLSKYGGIQWQKCLGGSRSDGASSIDTAAGNTYFIAGSVSSDDGDVSGHHNINSSDGWVAKLKGDGSIIWQKCLGGSRSDGFRAVRSTKDGGCIVTGITYSNDGDVTGNHNPDGMLHDGWVVKLDSIGNITWSKCFGSSNLDVFEDVIVTNDGNYVVAGTTLGNDGDATGNHPGLDSGISDGWVIKLDKSGNVIWKNCYGGNYNDQFSSVIQAPDGGYTFAGRSSSSSSFQTTGGYGILGVDVWILKTDAAGNVSWGKCYGGTFREFASAITLDKDGYVFGGQSRLNHGDVQGSIYNGENVWVGKIDFAGSLLWQRVLGGDKDEAGFAIHVAYDGFPVLFATTNSTNGDVRRLHPKSRPGSDIGDIWYAKFTRFNTISLNGFADFNSNNVKDIFEPFYAYYKAEVYRNNALVETNYPGNDTLRILTDTGSYKVMPLSSTAYYSPAPATIEVNFINFNNKKTSDVAFKPTGDFKDLVVKIIPITGNLRGGRQNTYRIFYENVGTNPVSDPVIEFIKDARTKYIGSSTNPSAILNDTIKYSINGLTPLTNGYIDITLENSTTLFLNDTIKQSVTILPLATDNFPSDNQFNVKEIIIGSYDPNDKTENHGGYVTKTQITEGEYLNYTIRFQNTGNDTAFFVSVRDTLSSKYDLSKFEMIAASHPYSLEISDNACSWNFYTINLVDSNHNEPASHGFVAFRIRAKNTLPEGDTLKNSASIYFDYNPPVRTDNSKTAVRVTTVTAIDPLGSPSLIKFFPNPVINGKFIVQSEEWLKGNVFIEIFNQTGTLVTKLFVGKNLNKFTKEIDLSRYSFDNYVVVVRSENARYAGIMIKLR